MLGDRVMLMTPRPGRVKEMIDVLGQQDIRAEAGVFVLPDTHPGGVYPHNIVVFGDVGVNPTMTPEILAHTAVGTCAIARDLGCLFAIDTDAHAPGQLDFLAYGAERAEAAGIDPDRIVTTWSRDRLLEWAAP